MIMKKNNTYEIYDAQCIGESRNGESLLINAGIFEEPEYIAKSVIVNGSEVTEVGDKGTLIIEGWLARHREWK